MKRTLAAALLLTFSFSLIASDQELNSVQQQINKMGLPWQASKTAVSELSNLDRKNHLGAAPLSGDPLIGSSGGGISSPSGGGGTTSSTVPATLDWRSFNGINFVTPVENQGSCASCWVFAPTAALESQVAIVNGGLQTDESEEIGLDCSGGGSCSGGYASTMSSFIVNSGLPSASYAGYTASQSSCPNNGWQNYAVKADSYSNIPASISAIESALATYGPMVIRMYVYNDFFYYSGGVYSYSGSGTYEGAHYVLLVGYDANNQYFIIKNSWGSGWGMAGYANISFVNFSNSVAFGSAGENYAYYTSSAPSSLTLTAPGGGAALTAGTNASVSWNYSGSPCSTVNIELLNAGASYAQIASSVSIGSNGAGSYTWSIPSTETSGNNYQIAITCVSNPAFSSTSGVFAINPLPPPPSAPSNLTAAVVTKTVRKKTTYYVQLNWVSSTSSIGIAGYNIFRSQNGQSGQEIAAGVSSTSYQDAGTVSGGGTYTYTVQAKDSAGQLSSMSNAASVTR